MQVRQKLKLEVGEYDWQSSMGCVRLFIFGFLLIGAIGWFGGIYLDRIDPISIAEQYRQRIWFIHYLPQPILVFFASIVNWNSLRYMIAPLGAIVFIVIRGSFFVQDVYAIPEFKDALNYVIASMFGLNYPGLVVDKGEKQVSPSAYNLIDKIGGPGFVLIEPGNAVMFKRLREPSIPKVSETHFLAPFETIASSVNLDEQQDVKDEMTAMTRDGIKVKIKDVHFRYRVTQEETGGVPVRRSLENPYPFSEDAIRRMTFNLMVERSGLESWRNAVKRSVTGSISDYVSANSIDHITAPRTNDYNPHLELRSQLFVPEMRGRLANLGAELLWVDVGHIEIEEESVDELRTNVWSAEWMGDAAEARAYGEAIRQAYQELGRAEAQANLIMSIAGALSEANLSDNSTENVRKILLARTAQIIDALGSGPHESGPHESEPKDSAGPKV